MLNIIIWIINLIGALLTVMEWVRKPEKKFLAIIGLILAIISLATTQFTLVSIIALGLFIILIILLYSLKLFSQYDKELAKTSVIIKGKSKKEIDKLIRSIFDTPIYGLVETAKAVAYSASKGIDFNNIKESVNAAGVLSIAVDSDFIDALEVLIILKQSFKDVDEYISIADLITTAVQKGIPLIDQAQIVKTYLNEITAINNVRIKEYFAFIITLKKESITPEAIGKNMAAMVNVFNGLAIK